MIPGGRPQNTLGREFRRLSLGVTAAHDEIKPERHRNTFLAHGYLFVPDDWRTIVLDALWTARRTHGCFDEIHFSEIRGASSQNKRFLVARDWVRSYFTHLVRGCPFKAFIVEEGLHRHFPYPGDDGYDEHLLLSMKSALKAGIAWSFYRESMLRLRIVNDDSDSELDRAVAQRVPAVLQSECNTRRVKGAKRYPWLRVLPAEFVDSNPRAVDGERLADSELIQMCDLLLGGSFDALKLRPTLSERAGRRQLAASVLEGIAETVRLPWLRQVPVHRKFSVSLYPDRFNFAYPAALRLARDEHPREQAPLPGIA